jgi:hypothetical protein
VRLQRVTTAPRAIFTLAAVSAVPLFHWGCDDVALLGRPALDARSRRDKVEFIGTLEELDHSRRELYLRTQGGQSQIVTYTDRTRIALNGEQISASKLGRGDIVEVQMHGTADGRAVADSMRVRERGNVRNTILGGMVERVLSDRRVIELRTPSGALISVYLPQNSPQAEDEFRQLRSGDVVRFQGIFLSENRFELTRILKQPE